jgi:hypothetical protein
MTAHPPAGSEHVDGIFICTCDEASRQEAADLLEEVRSRLDSELTTLAEQMAQAGIPSRRGG